MPEVCEQVEGCLKKKDAKMIGLFKTESLLNVEGKIFLSVLAKWMSEYMVSNPSIQKAEIQGFSGCLKQACILHPASTNQGGESSQEGSSSVAGSCQCIYFS